MRKLIIGKNDDPSLVVEKILSARDRDLIIVVPKFSKLAESVSNFHLLKREAEADNKNLLIESVDDDALALAQAAKLAGINPFLSARKKSMSDIVPPPLSEANSSLEEKVANDSPETILADSPASTPSATVEFSAIPPRRRLAFFRRRPRLLLLAFVFLPIFAVALASFLPSVTIELQAKSYDWRWREPVSAIVDLTENPSAAEKNILPAIILAETRNLSLEFLASGSKKVERKAQGVVTIYNAYSSRPQPLIATTRLLTPDGKLFRLTESVTVPGAKIEQGNIIPSSITANVVADQPGAEYNLGPVSRFSIPGFQGSSKYEGFYAESHQPMTGGFIGTVAFATDDDIKKAKENLTATLRENLTGFVLSSLPEGFMSSPGASEFNLLDIRVNSEANDQGQFSVFGEAELRLFAFPKEPLLKFVTDDAASELGFPTLVKDFNFDLADVVINFKNGHLDFIGNFTGQLTRQLNPDQITNDVAGRSADELKKFLLAQAGIAGAKISFWPFWVNYAPGNPARVNLKIIY